MDDLLQSPIPAETNATCESCAMVVPPESGEQGYNPATKCCTFHPDLWNFLAGAVLLDDAPENARGRATVEARLDRGVGVTPLGLRRTSAYRLIYRGTQGFGQSRTLLCPHYIDEQGGLCGVWRHRESTCTTWFCKFVRGEVGQDFWNNLHQLLRSVEEALSAWCLLELRMDQAVMATLYRPFARDKPSVITGADLDGEASEASRDGLWGTWRGREREFYRACAALVAPLKWDDVARIAGAETALFARLTQVAHARLVSDDVPLHPTAALVQITPRGAGRARLATYSGSDALEVPSEIADLLAVFDGRPLQEALASARQDYGVSIDPSLVRKLADFGVLREARTNAIS